MTRADKDLTETRKIMIVDDKEMERISFFIPAYNCEETIQEAVESIMAGNFSNGDELIIVNDGSTDNTARVLTDLKKGYPDITIIDHSRNKGGAAARNTAVENSQNRILFCLDSDNVLAPGSVPKLRKFMLNSSADAAAFQELHYFRKSRKEVTHKWKFRQGVTTLADCLAGYVVPVASGNYMFTKESWIKAGGYPEFAGALDAWGFGCRQLATGAKMVVFPNHYYHRYGHESYWCRDSKNGKLSLTATQILIPFIDLINDKDVDYIMGRKGRYSWFENLEKRPLKLKEETIGKTGAVIDINSGDMTNDELKWKLILKIKKYFSAIT